MDTSSQAQALRHLLAVARKLRDLADDVQTIEADRELFLISASALEARAKWLATSPPGDRCEPHVTAHLHQPVDLLI